MPCSTRSRTNTPQPSSPEYLVQLIEVVQLLKLSLKVGSPIGGFKKGLKIKRNKYSSALELGISGTNSQTLSLWCLYYLVNIPTRA
jgi:hypothetical protein